MHLFAIFFFNDTATTDIYTLSLHDALPICRPVRPPAAAGGRRGACGGERAPARAARGAARRDRKSTRLNSSHQIISYAVFCLKKKKGDARIFREFEPAFNPALQVLREEQLI